MTAVTMTQSTTPARSTSEDSAQASRHARTAALFETLATTTDERRRASIREELITLNMPVATAIARRDRGRGESSEDLTQVACLALVTAVDGFDPERGYDFLAYAVPTIRGAVRRHFRDKAWDVRPPRRIQELRAKVEAASERLSHELGRSPRPSELAADLGVEVDEVSECLASGDWYHVQSLDAPATSASGTGAELADLLGSEDPELDLVESRVSVQPLLAKL